MCHPKKSGYICKWDLCKLHIGYVPNTSTITVPLDLGMSWHCHEDNRILEAMIVATIVAIVSTINKIAKLTILKAKFKEINNIIWKIKLTIIHFTIVMLEIPQICALKTFV